MCVATHSNQKEVLNIDIWCIIEKVVSTMAYFIVQFPLKTEKNQEDILGKRFEIGRQIYNSLVNITQKRYREMIKTKNYRNLISQLSGDKKKTDLFGNKSMKSENNIVCQSTPSIMM